MNIFDPYVLCMKLLNADTEVDVVVALSEQGLWDNESLWRPLGGDVNNYSSAGNQQSRAEQAVIEKLINAIDTKLVAACSIKGIDPKSLEAPTSMQKATGIFFGDQLGDLEALSRSICVSATGKKPGDGRPSFTIVDDGEGQTPASMHSTILSLHAGNKKQIRFVQGKFNMGGTGVLEFCGIDRNVQFILSKRNPALNNEDNAERDKWSFTVIRRNDPETPGGTSQFVYLAPVGADELPGKGNLIIFSKDKLPIFPERNSAYSREAAWGTLFKLYEYEANRFATHILRDGLMDRVRALLPEPALPIRFHECREYRGHEGSFDTTMVGLVRTLHDDIESDKRNNVEWYDKFEFKVRDEKFTARIYLFKDKKTADTYRKDEGIIFSYNGQSHASLTKDFFRRKRVKQDYLWHSLLMVVDCSEIGPRTHEELFMNSRDRLRDKEIRRALEDELQDILANHDELRQLANERRKKELADKPKASESMAKVIRKLLEKNPTLASLLGQGLRIHNPFQPDKGGEDKGGFEGKRFPTFFRFKGLDQDAVLKRDAHVGSHCRIAFETDASNDYFKREDDSGEFELFVHRENEWHPAEHFQRPRLHYGIAHLSMSLAGDVQPGDEIKFKAVLTDTSRIDAFENLFTLDVKKEIERSTNGSGGRNSRTEKEGENKGADGKGNKNPQDTFLDIPNPVFIKQSDWGNHEPEFDKYTALRIKRKPGSPEDRDEYDYLLNIDNIYLQNFVKSSPKNAETFKMKFAIGMVLIALSLLHQKQMIDSGSSAVDYPEKDSDVSDFVQAATSGIAPFLLPLIDSVSALEAAEEEYSESAGEAA